MNNNFEKMLSRNSHNPSPSMRVVKSELTPAGEKVEVVRPVAEGSLSSNEIVEKLLRQYDYKTSRVRAQQ